MSVTGFNRRRRELAKKKGVVDGGRQTEARDTEGSEAKKEPTFQELREQAKEKQIVGYGRMNKQELIDTLRGE